MNIHLTLPQEKLTAFYLGQVSQESRGLRMHIRRYRLSLLLMKLLKHNLNSGITKTEKEDLKRRSATATYWFPVTEPEMLLFTYVDLGQ